MANPTTPAPETTKRFSFPSAYTILFALIVIIAALTWVIPAGQYERVASEALGKELPVADQPKARQSATDETSAHQSVVTGVEGKV